MFSSKDEKNKILTYEDMRQKAEMHKKRTNEIVNKKLVDNKNKN